MLYDTGLGLLRVAKEARTEYESGDTSAPLWVSPEGEPSAMPNPPLLPNDFLRLCEAYIEGHRYLDAYGALMPDGERERLREAVNGLISYEAQGVVAERTDFFVYSVTDALSEERELLAMLMRHRYGQEQA